MKEVGIVSKENNLQEFRNVKKIIHIQEKKQTESKLRTEPCETPQTTGLYVKKTWS